MRRGIGETEGEIVKAHLAKVGRGRERGCGARTESEGGWEGSVAFKVGYTLEHP